MKPSAATSPIPVLFGRCVHADTISFFPAEAPLGFAQPAAYQAEAEPSREAPAPQPCREGQAQSERPQQHVARITPGVGPPVQELAAAGPGGPGAPIDPSPQARHLKPQPALAAGKLEVGGGKAHRKKLGEVGNRRSRIRN